MKHPRSWPLGVIPFAFAALGVLAASGSGAWAADPPDQGNVGSPGAAVRPHRPNARPGRLPELLRTQVQAPALHVRKQALGAEPGRLPESANKAAIQPATCPDEAAAYGIPVVCGYVPVPLDWSHPGKLGQIKIYFELYSHTGDGPAESAILNNYGGPGAATTARRWIGLYFFGENLDTHDLLLIDDRGRGLSGTIDCPDLQHGAVAWATAEAECAAQLGLAASRYGTGEVAQDTDAVRAALGYDKVDYFGWSYGGNDVEAYATRFGDHLRSIVADSPSGSPARNQFNLNHARVVGERRMVRMDCTHSPTCSADHRFPEAELDVLAWWIRNHPVEGDAYDANGNPVHVLVDEETLLNSLVANPIGNFTNTGELLAAGSALWRGDPVPLLRLGAEFHLTLESDMGDPTGFSTGAMLATWNVDMEAPWDWSRPIPVRQAQYDAAAAALPPWYFAPFSKQVGTGLLFDYGLQGLWWEVPTRPSLVVPRHARYPHVPTLVLSGDMDQAIAYELSRPYADLFPDSVFIPVAGAGHGTFIWSSCAARLASEFIRTLKVADSRCAHTPDVVWPAVGRFPLLAREARPADPDRTGENAIGLAERKVVTVAVAAATDAMQRSIIGWGSGVGLRGGTFSTDYGDFTTWTATLTECAFAEDVTVSGTVTWSPGSPAMLGNPGDGSFTADLTVGGSGTKGGTLRVQGKWQARGPVGNFKVTGTLGGKSVAVLVPEA